MKTRLYSVKGGVALVKHGFVRGGIVKGELIIRRFVRRGLVKRGLVKRNIIFLFIEAIISHSKNFSTDPVIKCIIIPNRNMHSYLVL